MMLNVKKVKFNNIKFKMASIKARLKIYLILCKVTIVSILMQIYFLINPVKRKDILLSQFDMFKLDKEGWKHGQIKPQELLLIRKFVRRIKDSKCKSVDGKIFEKAANLGSYEKPRFAAHSKICPQN